MGEEIESLYALLGIKPDEASAADAVSKLVKAVQAKLKSSVYGGKDGVITLPATLEGKFKNGKEINQDIKDAYAAIYNTAKKMADESVSLTLKDIENFKAQIDKFGKKTAKYKGSDVIANANNNLRQTLGDYQAFVNDLRKEVSVQQKAQTKQAQKAKAQAKANKKQKGYIDTGAKITNENIEGDIKNRKLRLMKGLKSVLPKGYGSGWINPSSTNDYESKHSEISFYGSRQARQVAQSAREARKWERESLTVDKYDTKEKLEKELAKRRKEDPKFKQSSKKTIVVSQDGKMIPQDVVTEWEVPKSTKPRELSPTEKAGSLSEDIRNNILPELIDKIKTSTDDKEVGELTEKFFNTLEAISKLNQDAGKLIFSDVKKDIGIAMGKLGFTTDGKIGGIDAEEGTDKTAASKDPRIEALMRGLLDKIAEKQDAIKQELIKLEQLEKQTTKTKATKESNSFANRIIAEAHALNASQKQNSQAVAQADTKALAQELKGEKSRDEKSYIQDVRESSREASADTAEGQKNQSMLEIEQQDIDTGFNTDAKADQAIEAIESSKGMATLKDAMCPCKELLSSILTEIQNITKNGININDKQPGQKRTKEKAETGLIPEPLKALTPVKDSIEKALVPVAGTLKTFYEGKDLYKEQKQQRILEADSKRPTTQGPLSRSLVETTVQDPHKEGKRLGGVFARLANIGANYEKIMARTSKEQDAMAAERIRQFGLDRNRNSTDTGDKASFARSMSLWRGKDKFSDIFKDLKLSEGIEVDTTKVTEALSKVLAGKEMFNAQTGGAWRNLLGSMTGYIGMPSLEKSRSQADAVNQIMANIRKAMNDVLNDIQRKESALEGMKESGDLKLGADGSILESSTTEAKTLVAQLEEQKMVLASILADAGMVGQVVDQTGGRISEIVKKLGFTSPVLRENNAILANINAGLDKSGKALKFQTRTAEVLNYSFQLMARHIGQMIKNWIMMLNPLSLIKRAFQDFASYDTKWQRTMNVIKYNLRRIIRPFMEWIAQQLVNIIGLVNALVIGIGKAFGKKWDLFDQSAASAEQMREELEQAANVTASFDELHDVGTESSSNPAMDLMGDIYTPQWTDLYDTIENFGKKIGDVLAGIKKLTEGWNFWTWLAVIGGALIGLKVLKWLIGLFKKGNPLKSVADGFSFLEKAVGWALLIWAFTEFTKALTGFVECMKTANWEDIAKALIMLGSAFALLVAGISGVGGVTALLKATPKDMLGMSALVFAFDGFVKAIVPFIECIKDLGKDAWPVLGETLAYLVTTFIALIGGVAGVEGVTKGIGLMGKELLGLAAVVGALDLFVAALVPFIETISQIEGDKWDAIIPMIVGLGGAFIALAAGVATVSKTFTAMDWKAVGQLYVVAGAFEAFMLVLIPFINAIKDIPFETLAGGAILIAGAFISLGIAVGIMGKFFQGLPLGAFIELVALIAVMAGVIWVLSEFAKSLQELTSEQLLSGLALLAGAIILISVAIGVLATVFTGLVTTGIGAIAIVLLGVILGVIALIIAALADFVRALGEAGEGIKQICEGIAEVVHAVGDVIIGIVNIIIGKVAELAIAIAHEIGETIKTIIETVGKVITDIINSVINAIPNLLQSIVNFCHDIGPAIENSVDAIIRSITKLVNFVVSAVEYVCNLVIGAINELSFDVPDWVPGIGGSKFGFNIQKMEIPRFVPKYETGTNYVPNDGLAYLHQGEAVVPKKYNQPYQQQGLSQEEREYMNQMMRTMSALNTTMSQGIPVKGEFKQRGNDLVAVVEKARNRNGNQPLNNAAFAR